MNLPVAKASILSIAPYVPGRAKAEGFARPIKLSSNENALGCSEAARMAYREAAADLHLYPDSQATALREAIAEKYAIEPNRILFGTGSDEIFNMVCQTYLEPGDNIVQPRHGFAAWAIAALAVGGVVKSAPERNFTVDVDALLEGIDARTRIVFIANPANPTGTHLPLTEIARLHRGMPNHVVLVLDGAYAEYARGVGDYEDGIELARNAGNVMVTRTFSKLYGLAALRIGWGYAPAPVVEAINRIRLPYNASRPAQAAAIAALADDEFVDRSVAFAAAHRTALTKDLSALGLAPIRSATNFVTVAFPSDAPLSAAAAEHRLAECGILVRGLTDYGLPHCLRVTVGQDEARGLVIEELSRMLGRTQALAKSRRLARPP